MLTMRDVLTAVAASILLIASVLTVLLLVMDIGDARRDPITYEAVHQLNVNDYVRRNKAIIAMATVTGVVALLRFLDRRRRASWGLASAVVLFAVLVAAAIGYTQWAATGFDH